MKQFFYCLLSTIIFYILFTSIKYYSGLKNWGYDGYELLLSGILLIWLGPIVANWLENEENFK